MTRKRICIFVMLMELLMAAGCSGNEDNAEDSGSREEAAYYDGQYHAEYERYDVRNWRAYVDITVKDGKITKAYYDYTNETGTKRTDNKGYVEGFSAANNGMTPREAFDKLGSKLVESQDIGRVDAVSGATHSSRNFVELAATALLKASDGDTTPASIPLYEDGTYRVEGDAFDEHGWKPFVEITIVNDRITEVVFDYTNESGMLKTMDTEYKKNMEAISGTYPEKYTGELEQQLIREQVLSLVDAISGATSSSGNFTTLVEYALDDKAEAGDREPGIIKIESEE